MLNAQEIAILEHNINNVWSLADYLNHINTDARNRMAATPGLWVSELMEEIEHWAEADIHTARDLADYLDACYQKEVREVEQEEYWDQYDEILEAEAIREKEEAEELYRKYVINPL